MIVRTIQGYRLIKTLRFEYPNENLWYEIPKGFEYDGATFPKFLWLDLVIRFMMPDLDKSIAVFKQAIKNLADVEKHRKADLGTLF